MRLNIVDLTASLTDAALDRQLRLLPNCREAPFKSSIVDRTRSDYKYPKWESYKGYNLIVARCRFSVWLCNVIMSSQSRFSALSLWQPFGLYMSEQFGAILRAVAQAEQIANGIRGTSEIMSDLAGQTIVVGESATLAQDGRIIN